MYAIFLNHANLSIPFLLADYKSNIIELNLKMLGEKAKEINYYKVSRGNEMRAFVITTETFHKTDFYQLNFINNSF